MRQEVIYERREQVKALMLARVSIHKIAEKLNWNPDTIFEDMKSIRREYKSRDLGEGDILVDFLLRNEEQYQNAKRLYLDSTSPDIRLRANKQMHELDRARLDTCQEFGIVQKQLGQLNIRKIEVTWKNEIIREKPEEKKDGADNNKLRAVPEASAVPREQS